MHEEVKVLQIRGTDKAYCLCAVEEFLGLRFDGSLSLATFAMIFT